MGLFSYLLYPWGIILQVLAVVHFIRRRPDGYWLFVILFLGPLGAIVYIFVEVLPDAGLLKQSFKVFPRRKRIHELEAAVLDNPSAGNYEELGELYSEEGQWARARQSYDKSISVRTDSLDPFYRRGIAELELGDFPAGGDGSRAGGFERSAIRFSSRDRVARPCLCQHWTARKADSLFQRAVKISTLSETYYNYATFLAVPGTQPGSGRLGDEDSGKEAHYAWLLAPARETVVPQSECVVEEAWVAIHHFLCDHYFSLRHPEPERAKDLARSIWNLDCARSLAPLGMTSAFKMPSSPPDSWRGAKIFSWLPSLILNAPNAVHSSPRTVRRQFVPRTAGFCMSAMTCSS